MNLEALQIVISAYQGGSYVSTDFLAKGIAYHRILRFAL
jgi:hypothetical protein